ncbi:hypothetical protein KR038_000275 [Drosophila bunnanda]|nr:hypothetical protein KR038_000275 [Drosophila bunnanda]
MASNKKEATGEEHLDRSCRMKMDIIRGLVWGQKCSKDRILCEDWFHIFSRSAKHEAWALDCVLDQMVRQLQQFGHLSHPFTALVNSNSDLSLLLDEEARQRLIRLSSLQRITPKPSRARPCSRRISPFVWRQMIKQLDTLEEKYRREEQDLWLNEISLPKEGTGINEVGVQVDLPVLAPQETKKRRDRERLRDQDQGLHKVTKRRQLDLQRKAEARQLRERHLLEQQLKVKKQRDHERNLMNKKREAQSQHLSSRQDHVTKSRPPSQNQDKATEDAVKVKCAREVKKPDPDARKHVKYQDYHRRRVLPPVTKCVGVQVGDQQATLRAEDVNNKVMAYDDLKQYHHKKAMAVRERLTKDRLDGGKSERRREIKNANGRCHKDETKGQEAQKEKATNAQNVVYERNIETHNNRKISKESDINKMQYEFKEKENEPQQESDPRQKKVVQRVSQNPIDFQEKYESRAKKDLLKDAEQITEKVPEKCEVCKNLLPVKLDERLPKQEGKKVLRKIIRELVIKARKNHTERRIMKEQAPAECKVEQIRQERDLRPDSEDSQEGKDMHVRDGCEEMQKQERLARTAGRSSRKDDLIRYSWTRAQENRMQTNLIREKCLQEINDTEAIIQKIQNAAEDSTTEFLEDVDRPLLHHKEKRGHLKHTPKDQPLQAGSSNKYCPFSHSLKKAEENCKQTNLLKEKFLQEIKDTQAIIQRIQNAAEDSTTEFLEDVDRSLLHHKEKRGHLKQTPKDQPLQAGSSKKYCSFSNSLKQAEENRKQTNLLREKFLQEIQNTQAIIQRIQNAAKDSTAACFKDNGDGGSVLYPNENSGDSIQTPKDQPLQSGSSSNNCLLSHSWKKAQENCRQANIIREKCMQELQDIEAAIQGIQNAGKDSAPATLEGKGNGRSIMHSMQKPKNQPIKKIYSKESENSTSSEEEPHRYSADIVVSYCTKTGRKRYPHISHVRTNRRREDLPHPRTFPQLITGSRPTEFNPQTLSEQNRILQWKFSVARTIALNKHIQETLMLEAERLIDLFLYENAKAQANIKPPRHIFETLINPLIQSVENISFKLLEAITLIDNQLEAHLGSLCNCTVEKQVQQLGGTGRGQNLVFELLYDFCNLDPKLNKTLHIIDQLYERWKVQRLGLQ